MTSSSAMTCSSAMQSMEYQVQPVSSERFCYTMHFFKHPVQWHTSSYTMVMGTFGLDTTYKLKLNSLSAKDRNLLNNLLHNALKRTSEPGSTTKNFVKDFHDYETPAMDRKTEGQDLFIKFAADAKVFDSSSNIIIQGSIPTTDFYGKALVKVLGVAYCQKTKIFGLMYRMVQVKIMHEEETICLLSDDGADEDIKELASKVLDTIDGTGHKKRAHGGGGSTGSKKNKLV